MPRGRFLDRGLSTNRQYWSMPADYRNFWDLLILWLDPLGRMDGDARIIKGIVCPLSNWTVDEIEEMLVKFESLKRSNGLGWITRYHSHGIYCLLASGFPDHQKGLQISHEAKGKYGYSNIPPPPKKLLKGEAPVKVATTEPPDLPQGDNKLAMAVKVYEEAFSRMITPPVYERLKDIIDTYTGEEFTRAVDEAKSHNVRSPIKYIEACLEAWHREEQPEQTEQGDDSEGLVE